MHVRTHAKGRRQLIDPRADLRCETFRLAEPDDPLRRINQQRRRVGNRKLLAALYVQLPTIVRVPHAGGLGGLNEHLYTDVARPSSDFALQSLFGRRVPSRSQRTRRGRGK